MTKLLILTSVEILPHYGFTGFGLCFAEMTGIQVHYYLDNCFARIIKCTLKRTGGNEFDKRSKRSIIFVSRGHKVSSGHQLDGKKMGINPV